MENTTKNPATGAADSGAHALFADLYTDEQIAIAAKVTPETVRRWRLKCGLPFVTVGQKPYVEAAAWRRWVEGRKVNASSAA